jgi:signal transduction histidine kinase
MAAPSLAHNRPVSQDLDQEPETRDGPGGEVRAMLDAVMAISSDLDLPKVLGRIVESAVTLTRARYGALGVIGPENLLVEFLTTGLTDCEGAGLGDLPDVRGILGLLITDPQPIRLRDLNEHPASYGFPPHHPPMGSFLGVPIRIRGTVFGNLYLTEKLGNDEFTETDEKLVVGLAGVAGLAIENARAYGYSERWREWLEGAASLPESLQPAVDWEGRLHQIAATARRIARSQATAIADTGDGDIQVLVCDPGTEDLMRSRLAVVLARVRGREVTEAVDVVVDDSVGTVVPLRTHLTRAGLLVSMFDGADLRHRDLDDRELLSSFADYAALTLDRGQAITEREALAVVSDRERIARDLHDLVIQRLFATGMQLQAASMRVADTEVRGRLERAVADLDATIRDVRATIFELQSPATGSLRSELRALVREYRSTLSFVPRLHLIGPIDTAVADSLREPLLKVLREALSNLARHAQASHADIEVAVAEGPRLVLTVEDDGVGMADEGPRSGLENAETRATVLGGFLRVENRTPSGTRLIWSVPLVR